MGVRPPRGQLAAVVAALSLIIIAVGFMQLRGGSTPVAVDTAIERFRTEGDPTPSTREVEANPEATPTTTDEPPRTSAPVTTSVTTGPAHPQTRPRPREGVYTYTTTGGDDVDVLGGSRHTYPAKTTVTVRHTDCGFDERWDALEERWDERTSCSTPGGEELRSVTSFHEFFGRADQRTLQCKGFSFPKGAKPGDSWSMRCASDTTQTAISFTAVDWEDVAVAGQPVRTLHVHAELKLTGEQQGSGVRDVWGSIETGVNVREKAEMTSFSNQPVFGRTRYHESYDIRVESLQPQT
jgi:hypothetical protein